MWKGSTFKFQGATLFQAVAPDWYKTPLPGPAAYKQGRLPGCNGMVCYCNNGDYCNSADVTVPGCLLVIGWCGNIFMKIEQKHWI